MTVTITKTKPKTVTISKAQMEVEQDEHLLLKDLSIEALADRYGDLADKVKMLKEDPTFALFDEAEAELKERLKQYPAEQAVDITGQRYKIEAGPCAKAPAIITNMTKVYNLLGPKVFFKLCSVTLGHLREYLNPEQLKQVINEETGRTEKRAIKTKHIA